MPVARPETAAAAIAESECQRLPLIAPPPPPTGPAAHPRQRAVPGTHRHAGSARHTRLQRDACDRRGRRSAGARHHTRRRRPRGDVPRVVGRVGRDRADDLCRLRLERTRVTRGGRARSAAAAALATRDTARDCESASLPVSRRVSAEHAHVKVCGSRAASAGRSPQGRSERLTAVRAASGSGRPALPRPPASQRVAARAASRRVRQLTLIHVGGDEAAPHSRGRDAGSFLLAVGHRKRHGAEGPRDQVPRCDGAAVRGTCRITWSARPQQGMSAYPQRQE